MSHAHAGTHLYFRPFNIFCWPVNASAMFLAAVYAVPSLPGCIRRSHVVSIDALWWSLPSAAHGPRRSLPSRYQLLGQSQHMLSLKSLHEFTPIYRNRYTTTWPPGHSYSGRRYRYVLLAGLQNRTPAAAALIAPMC